MSSQKSEPFETPSRDQIPGITRGHVAAMEASDGEPEDVWVMYNMAHLLLRTIGRRSGRVHKVALPYWLDAAGEPIVVASYAGADEHPAWYLNLSAAASSAGSSFAGSYGELYVKTRRDAFWAEPQILEGEEYRTIWDQMILDRSYYQDYQALTERRLPLIRLRKRRPAPAPPAD